MTPDQNDNKLLTKRVQASERTTVILSYSTRDAAELRALASSFTLKGKRPSLSLLSRRALAIYSQVLRSPAHRDAEIKELTKLVTSTPAPAQASKRKAPALHPHNTTTKETHHDPRRIQSSSSQASPVPAPS